MFSCKVCKEKDERINDLQTQILFLRQFAIPTTPPIESDVRALEMDAVLSNTGEAVELSPEQSADYVKYLNDQQEIISERDRVLSGAY